MSFKTCGVLLLALLAAACGGIAYGPRLMVPHVAPAAAATAPETRTAALAEPPAPTPPPPPVVNDEPVAAPAPAASSPTNATNQPLPTPAPAAPVILAMNAIVLPAAPATPAPPPAPKATRADVDALVADMHGALGGTLLPDAPPLTRAALGAARAMMDRAHAEPDTLQVVIVVDRSPKVQRLWVTVATPGSPTLESLGSVHVSTGKPGRKEHFRTPVGVFTDDAGILGYRAEGTYNENHIRGIGVRGMRVWDFGWQTTDDWRTPRALMAVRMEMHATDPSVLEPRLGRWDSEGCIRIPSRFNSFLDRSGLIDAKEWAAAREDRRFAALLPKHVVPSRLAGQTLVVVDTSEPGAAPSDPVKAHLIAHPNTGGPEHDDAS